MNPAQVDRVVGSFQWVVSEYKRTFLVLVCTFSLAPFALILFLILMLMGRIASPVTEILQRIVLQHEQQYKALNVHSQAIIDNLNAIHDGQHERQAIIAEMHKTFKGQVANCFVAAGGNKEAIALCKDLQHLE